MVGGFTLSGMIGFKVVVMAAGLPGLIMLSNFAIICQNLELLTARVFTQFQQ